MDPTFASDNTAGVHPAVMAALAMANEGPAIAYGDDPWTARAAGLISRELGCDVAVFFVSTGTAANVTALAPFLRSHQAVILTDVAHMQVHECGAPELFTGCKLLTVPAVEGKLTPAALDAFAGYAGDEHMVQPRVVSITQATECGTVYTIAEIRALADAAHARGMGLHMDGARLANAAAALDAGLAATTIDAGVDVFTIGGTKNGLMYGEAVVFTDPAAAAEFKFIRKQAMQLHSKMRFIAAQFEAYFTGGLWRHNADRANRMACRLSERIAKLPGCSLAFKTQSNAVFASIPPAAVAALKREYYFHVWDQSRSTIRLMCAFDTTAEQVDAFVRDLAAAVRA